jgi:glycosyltransferase involved in cell wall biosynthesis
MRLITRWPMAHITLGPLMAEELHHRYKVEDIIVLNNSIFLETEAISFDMLPTRPLHTLGHYGNLTKEKGLYGVLALHIDMGGDVALRLAGFIPDVEDHEAVQRHVLQFPTCEYIGPLSQGKQIEAFLDSVDVLVFPSVNEAQPLVVLEAMSRGVPVLAHDVGGLSELRQLSSS